MKNQQLIYSAVATVLILCSSSHGFSYSKRKQQQQQVSSSSLHYTSNADNTNEAIVGGTTTTQSKPQWVPMEIIELAASDLHIPPSQFIQQYSDIEAYTSCDDDEDSLHECDFFGQYLGPTKWVHLTPVAREGGEVVNRLHFEIWRDVWERPHGSVEVADVVSKETLRYYNEFMLEEPRSSTTECTTTRPLVRVKVVPASFGLEGFEEAVWEAYEEEMNHHVGGDPAVSTNKGKCRAVTFVVAAPDLMDPILMEDSSSASSQVEFEPDRFRLFASSLSEKLREFEKIEGVPLMDSVELTSFHPLWTNSDECGIVSIDGSSQGCRYFPYPSVAVSTNVDV